MALLLLCRARIQTGYWVRTNSSVSGELVSHAAVLVQWVNVPLFGGLLGCAAYASTVCSASLHRRQQAAQLPASKRQQAAQKDLL